MNPRRKRLPYMVLILLSSILAETPVVKGAISVSSVEAIRVRDADLNGDGVVNIIDIYRIAKCFGSHPGSVRWNSKADLNDDCSVNLKDIFLAGGMYGKKRALTHVVAYVEDLTNETACFIASHFDVVIIGFDTALMIGVIKALNPDIIVLGYRDIMAICPDFDDWEEVDSHEDWFLHDVHGNRLIHKKWGWYAMDVGNTGWRNHYANYMKDKLEISLFDGVFADDVWDTFFAGSGWNPWNVPIEDVPVEIKNRWHSDMLEMIRFCKESLREKLLIVNTSNNDDYVYACDGKMEEGFAHPQWWPLEKFHDDWDDWKGKVESLKNISQSGKYYLAQGGTIIPDNPTQAELDKVHDIMIYCFASFLLGANGESLLSAGRVTFGFNKIQSKDGSRGYYPEFDVSLGSSVGEYYSIGSVYARDFTGGKVLVNPTKTSHTVSLGENYKSLNEEIVSTITLAAHTAIILLRM